MDSHISTAAHLQHQRVLGWLCSQHFIYRPRIETTINVADWHPHPHDFGLLDPHTESAFQTRIPDADADPG
jgi:hypothetical protein